jgi:hypothetical protein
MEFMQHTINWCKGEIFENSMVALYGALIVIVSIFFREIGVMKSKNQNTQQASNSSANF